MSFILCTVCCRLPGFYGLNAHSRGLICRIVIPRHSLVRRGPAGQGLVPCYHITFVPPGMLTFTYVKYVMLCYIICSRCWGSRMEKWIPGGLEGARDRSGGGCSWLRLHHAARVTPMRSATIYLVWFICYSDQIQTTLQVIELLPPE